MDKFKGSVLHSCQFKDASICEGKNVIVVGGGKSSIDCCVAAAKAGAKTSSLVFRSAHWPVPRKLLNLVPFKVRACGSRQRLAGCAKRTRDDGAANAEA